MGATTSLGLRVSHVHRLCDHYFGRKKPVRIQLNKFIGPRRRVDPRPFEPNYLMATPDDIEVSRAVARGLIASSRPRDGGPAIAGILKKSERISGQSVQCRQLDLIADIGAAPKPLYTILLATCRMGGWAPLRVVDA